MPPGGEVTALGDEVPAAGWPGSALDDAPGRAARSARTPPGPAPRTAATATIRTVVAAATLPTITGQRLTWLLVPRGRSRRQRATPEDVRTIVPDRRANVPGARAGASRGGAGVARSGGRPSRDQRCQR